MPVCVGLYEIDSIERKHNASKECVIETSIKSAASATANSRSWKFFSARLDHPRRVIDANIARCAAGQESGGSSSSNAQIQELSIRRNGRFEEQSFARRKVA